MNDKILKLPNDVAPRGSFSTEKATGSCCLEIRGSGTYQATEWDDPQATRLILCPSSPCTMAGFLFTTVVLLPC